MNLEKTALQDVFAKKTPEKLFNKELPDDFGRRPGKIELPGDTGADFRKLKQALERAANGIKSKITSELPNMECEENKTHSVGAKMTDSECEIMKQLYGDSVEKDPELMRTEIKEFCNWSDEIVDAIGSLDEFKIYRDADLKEAIINGKPCLIRNDIDWNQKDAMGRTNRERAENGMAPVNKDGKVIELHHIGQHADSPLAELTPQEHRGIGNDTVLHDKNKESEIDRNAFNVERSEHWKARSETEMNTNG